MADNDFYVEDEPLEDALRAAKSGKRCLVCSLRWIPRWLWWLHNAGRS